MPVISHSLNQFVVVGLALALVTGWVAVRSHSLGTRIFLMALSITLLLPSAILGLGMNPWLVDARYRSYRLFYWNIQRGMDRTDVIASLENRYPADGKWRRPRVIEDSDTTLTFAMDPVHIPEADREIISLKMQVGKVTGKRYFVAR